MKSKRGKLQELNEKYVVTRKELASCLGVSRKTLYRWMVKHQINLEPGLIRSQDLKLIRKKLGL